MIKLLKKHLFIFLLIFISFFFYSFRIDKTFVMATDTARDLVRVMEIWQNKEITVIGPVLSFSSNNLMEIHFGSFHYYFGLIGLMLAKFNPVGSIYINILLFTLSIPLFYSLSKKLIKPEKINILTTLIYSIAPVTVAHARSYWNPNLVIPFAVFFWYLVLTKSNKKIFHFLAGIIAGVIFNLHYINILPILAFYIYASFKKKQFLIWDTFGFILISSPLIAFEIKNNFFLTKAFIDNISNISHVAGKGWNPFIVFDSFLSIFGLGPKNFYMPGQINIPLTIRLTIDSILGILVIFQFIKKGIKFSNEIITPILVGLFVAWIFSTWNLIQWRYFFSIYPLLIILFANFISSINYKLIFILLIPLILLSSRIIFYNLDPTIDYYPLSKIEEISKTIINDNPQGKYNITENILGDARSMSFRYYLMRDAKVKPQGVEQYQNLDTLYVASSSFEKIYQQNRWEFSASGPKKIVWEKDFGDLKLFKFSK